MTGILLLTIVIIAGFITGLLVWKWIGMGDGNKFDQRSYKEIMDAEEKKKELESAISVKIKSLNQKTRQALKEDMGEVHFRNYLRG